MPNAIEAQIKNRIAEFVQELDQLVRKSTLEALQGVLAGSGAPARRGPGRPAGVRRGPGRPRGSGRGNADEAAAAIQAHVRANDGQGISAIAAATGVALPVAKAAAKKLLAEGALKKSGEKRGTVYHVGSGRPARAARTKARRKPPVRRKAKRRALKKRARKAPRRKPATKKKQAATKKAVIVPVRKVRPPAPKETMVPEHLETPALAAG